ncbi:SGNH/GDSL hydrolase family protein [Alicyclobacillus acidiphilus]|nr:SGNH/GDSL hydrolase family protein [Alicyclobacillus acidiphilus]
MRIVCAGDSLTRGVSLIRGRLRIVENPYPKLLEQSLRSAFGATTALGEITVTNRGAFNDNSSSLLKRLAKDVLSEEPDIVVIEIGANDCDFRWNEVAEAPDLEHTPYVPLERFASNIERMVEQIQEAGAKPLLLTLLPLDPVRYYRHLSKRFGTGIAHWIACCGGIEHWHNRYDEALRQCVGKLGVDHIDVRARDGQVQLWRSMLSDDGIHLTATGYQHVSSMVFSSLFALRLVNPGTVSETAAEPHIVS